MDKIYIFPLVNIVLIPGNIVGLIINDEKLVHHLSTNMKFIASLLKDEKKIEFHNYGCLCEIIGLQKISDNTFILQLKTSKRVKIQNIEFEDIYPFTINYKIMEEIENEEEISLNLKQEILNLALKYIPTLHNEQLLKNIKNKKLCNFTDTIVSLMRANAKIKQKFLEEPNCVKRAEKLLKILQEIIQRWPGKILTFKTFIPKPFITTIYLS